MYEEITNKLFNSGIERRLKTHTIESKFHAIIIVERVKIR